MLKRSLISLPLMGLIVMLLAASPSQAVTTLFTGGDVGEGLDLSGTYIYAMNAAGAGSTVQGLRFTADGTQVGSTVTSSRTALGVSNVGASANDNALEILMKDLRFEFANNGTVDGTFVVTPDQTYEVQLLLGSQAFGGRTQDILINGVTVEDNLSVPAGNTGRLVSHTFVATSSIATLTLGPSTLVGGNGVGGDNNAVLNAFAIREINTRTNVALGGEVIAGSSSFNGFAFDTPGLSGDFTAGNVIDGSTTDIFAQNYWLGSQPQAGATEFFVLDLGATFDVDEIRLLNTHNSNRHNDSSTQDFEILGALSVDGSGNLIDPFLIVDGTLSDTSNQNQIMADIFNAGNGLDLSRARFIQFTALNFRGSRAGLNEIQVFGELAIPEPTTAVLALLGVGAMARRRRRMTA